MHVTNPDTAPIPKTKGVATVRMDPSFYDKLSNHVKDRSEAQRKIDGEEISLNKWINTAIERQYGIETTPVEGSVHERGRDNEQPPV